MAVAANSSGSSHIEKLYFNQLVFFNYLDLFSCINYLLTVKYTTEKLVKL